MSNARNNLIQSNADIRRGVAHLRQTCPVIRAVHDRAGDPPLRRHAADFSGLSRIIVGQQLSIAAADAIWSRLATGLGTVTPETIAFANDEALSAHGLSRSKVKTLRALSEAVSMGRLDLAGIRRCDDDGVRAMLTEVSGIGPWTADIYVMFCLGRRDAWAAGDLALQIGLARAFELGDRASAEQTIEFAERWRPWRGVAARLIWADYANLRKTAPTVIATPTAIRKTANRAKRTPKS